MYYSRSTNSFYDEAFHDSRSLQIDAPGWVRPTIAVPDPAWNAADYPDGTLGPFIVVPDPAAVPETVDAPNPDCKIPADAVEITAEEHAALLVGQSAGKRIVADNQGRPTLTDPPPPTAEQMTVTAKFERNARLAACDWTQGRDIPATVSAVWAPYRQALRDLPEQPGFPVSIAWPKVPA